MSRSYPIGSLLLLAKGPDLELRSRDIEAEIAQDCSNELDRLSQISKTDEEYYILDGQQRITSIACVFLDAHPKKCYYFDLKAMLHYYEQEDVSWISILRRGTSSSDRKKNNRLLKADIILNQAKTDVYVTEYIEDSKDSEYREDKTKGREAAAKLKGIFEVIRNYKVPAIILESDSRVESICRIFETINSTGTKLTIFDLAVARFYPKPDLRKLWLDAQEKNPIFRRFETDGERILQVLYLVTAIRSEENKYIDPAKSNLLTKLKINLINEEWEKSSKSLAKAYEFAQSQGAQPKALPRLHSILVSLAAMRSLVLSEKGVDPLDRLEDQAFIRRWYFSKIMQPGRAAANYQISQDFQALRKYFLDGKRPEFPQVTLDVNILLRLKSSDVLYKAIQNILATKTNQDLLSGKKISPESSLHNHHIFPKNASSKHKLDQSMLDSICNCVSILEKSNLSLGEGYPQDYFKEMVDSACKEGEATLGDLSKRMKDYLIPGDPRDPQWTDSFSIDRFREFCHKRARLILLRVHEIVGDSLQQPNAASGDVVIEDDEE